MAFYSPELLYKKMSDVQETFGALSQSSQFMVSLNLSRSSTAGTLNNYLTDCGLFREARGTSETYDFLCSDATLPGSAFSVAEESGSRQGILERFPIQRIYSDFDLSFYVDKEYNTIRLFEEWLNWIDPLHTGAGVYQGEDEGQEGFDESNSFFRFRYPRKYKTKVSILKFERGFWDNPNKTERESRLLDQPILKYDFIDTYPMNIVAIPFSYEGTTMTKVSVSFSYARYAVTKQRAR